MSNRIKGAFAALLLSCALGQSTAASLTLEFTGHVADATEFSFDRGGTHCEFWELSLRPFSTLSVNQGDTNHATVSLDAPHLTSSNNEPLAFLFGLTGPAFPSGDTSSGNATTAFVDDGVAGPTGGPLTLFTSGQPTTTNDFAADQPFRFDKVVLNFAVDQLPATALIESGSIDLVLTSARPYLNPNPAPGRCCWTVSR